MATPKVTEKPSIYYNRDNKVRFKYGILNKYISSYKKLHGEDRIIGISSRNSFSFDEVDHILCSIGDVWAWIDDPVLSRWYLSPDINIDECA